jgi:hypothetical protein
MSAVPYAGLEKVNPEKLQRQHADDDLTATSLVASFTGGDWRHRIESSDDGPSKRRVRLVSPEMALSPEAFHDLVDVMMVAAVENHCAFDGFQVEAATVRAP